MTSRIVPVILCGGSGARLWPLSRLNKPKQFLPVLDDFSLLQNTLRRLLKRDDIDPHDIIAVTHDSFEQDVQQQLAEIDPHATKHILREPCARDTAATVAFATLYAARNFGADALLWLLPSDHHIGQESVLNQALNNAIESAKDSFIVTFGMTPTRPDTGYGYIKVDHITAAHEAIKTTQFVEKPTLETAQAYCDSKQYLWNSGMFLFTAQTGLKEYQKLAPALLSNVDSALFLSSDLQKADADRYAAIKPISFDYAIMEKSSSVTVIPCDPEWSDIGSWDRLYDLRKKDAQKNVITGRGLCLNGQGNLIQADKRLIAVAGQDDLIVVDTDDALLIANRLDMTPLKLLVENLKTMEAEEINGPSLFQEFSGTEKSWGFIKTLQGANNSSLYQTRDFHLGPGTALNRPAHNHDLVLLIVLEGTAVIEIEGETHILSSSENRSISPETPYKILNKEPSPFVFLEVCRNSLGKEQSQTSTVYPQRVA